MKKSVHQVLLRSWRYFIATMFVNFAGISVMLQALSRTSGERWQWCGFFLPLGLGLTLASALHEPMHRPFAFLLPGARRRFMLCHGAVVIVCTLIFGGLGYSSGQPMPVFVIIPMAVCALSVSLPFEPGFRWAGSRPAGIAVIAGLAVVIFSLDKAGPLLSAHPWLVSTLAVALAAGSFAVTFSRERWRARAAIPHTPMLINQMTPELGEIRKRERQARVLANNARWRTSVVDGTIRHWVKATDYARSHGSRSGSAGIALIGGILILVLVVLTNRNGTGVAEAFYHVVVAPDSNGERLFVGVPYFLALLVLAQGSPAPKTDWLYPISRRRRAQVAYFSSAWRIATVFLSLVGGSILAAWLSGVWLGLGLSGHSVREFVMTQLFVIPFLPLGFWGLLYADVKAEPSVATLTWLVTLFLPATGRTLMQRHTAWFCSPSGIITCAVLIAASQWAYYAALKRFYRRGDLLPRTTREAIGLA